MGDMDSASAYLERHLNCCSKHKRISEQVMVVPTSMLAQAYYRNGKYAKAEKMFQNARHYFQDKDRLAKELSVLNNELGMSICAQGRYKEARAYCQASADLRAECASRGEEITKSEVINDIADFYCAKDDYESAKQMCECAEASRWDAPDASTASKITLYNLLITRFGL
jgi:tetratricopeptide (TPR) repeat protein